MLFLQLNQKSLLSGNAIDVCIVQFEIQELQERLAIINGLEILSFAASALENVREKSFAQFANNSGTIKKVTLNTP